MEFRVNPVALRVAGISLNIANTPRCEIYTGDHLEYHSVQTGTKQDDMPELDVYKFDINFAKRPSPVISLKVRELREVPVKYPPLILLLYLN